MPRYLTEARRSYTSKNSALTEEEFWFHNCREDQSRKDRANILPSEVYRLDKNMETRRRTSVRFQTFGHSAVRTTEKRETKHELASS